MEKTMKKINMGLVMAILIVSLSLPLLAFPSKAYADIASLTPQEQVALNLTTAQQVDLYGDSNTKFVRALYRNILDRLPDDIDLEYWTTELNAGRVTRADVIYSFVFSNELKDKIYAKTAEEYVTFLYKNVLDREVDPQGYTGWVNNINSGMSREDVLIDFLNSNDLYSVSKTGFVRMLYDNILNRVASDEEVNYWATELSAGRVTTGGIVQTLVFSDELAGKVSLANPEKFVTFLYTNVLNVEVDPKGYAYWVGNMQNGMTGQEVLLHFTDSADFQNICIMFGLKP
jgi:hypothetical protein